MSDLLSPDSRRNKVWFTAPAGTDTQTAPCDKVKSYMYGRRGTGVRVVDVGTTFVKGLIGRASFTVGAAYELLGQVWQPDSKLVGSGILGLSPGGSSQLMEQSSLHGAREFLFDGLHGTLSFGTFDASTAPIKWTSVAVTSGLDFWSLPAGSLTVGDAIIGNTVVDTGTPDVMLPDNVIDQYFDQWPTGLTWRAAQGPRNVFIDCDAALRNPNLLPDLKVIISGDEFPLQGSDVIGRKAGDVGGKAWCLSTVQRMMPAKNFDAILG